MKFTVTCATAALAPDFGAVLLVVGLFAEQLDPAPRSPLAMLSRGQMEEPASSR